MAGRFRRRGPGVQWSYSNTNYIALGLIAEKVTGKSCRTELTQRILRPVKLTATELPTTRTLAHLAGISKPEVTDSLGG